LAHTVVVVATVYAGLTRNVPHHLGQLGRTDFVEEAVELDVLWHSRARRKQLDIIVERLLEIDDGEASAASLKTSTFPPAATLLPRLQYADALERGFAGPASA
jgi:hypothetical protein